MLMNCPRCGFSQPRDQYCAQCGVDMLNFRPPQTSAWKKFFGSLAVQLTFVLAIAAAIGTTLYRKSQRDIEERVRYLQAGAQIARSAASPTSDAAEHPPVPDTESLPPEEALAADIASESAPAGAAGAGNAGGVPAPPAGSVMLAGKSADTGRGDSAPSARLTGTYVVRVYYAEVNRTVLDDIHEESRQTGLFNKLGDYFAGILPTLDKRLGSAGRDIRILHREERGIDPGRTTQWFLGIHGGDPDNEVGLTTILELVESDGLNFRGNIEVLRSWKDPSDGPGALSQKISYPAFFEIQRGAGFFMSYFLPSRANSPEEEEALAAVPPFQIFKSPPFKTFGTQFVLFLEFDRL